MGLGFLAEDQRDGGEFSQGKTGCWVGQSSKKASGARLRNMGWFFGGGDSYWSIFKIKEWHVLLQKVMETFLLQLSGTKTIIPGVFGQPVSLIRISRATILLFPQTLNPQVNFLSSPWKRPDGPHVLEQSGPSRSHQCNGVACAFHYKQEDA